MMIIRYTPTFRKEMKYLTKKYPSIVEDLEILQEILKDNPYIGDLLSPNCYKVRMAISAKKKGKSGGARVITYLKIENDTVYLLSIYDKSEKTNITDKEISALMRDID